MAKDWKGSEVDYLKLAREALRQGANPDGLGPEQQAALAADHEKRSKAAKKGAAK